MLFGPGEASRVWSKFPGFIGYRGRDTTTDGSQDEHEGEQYHPQNRHKKRLSGLARPRQPSTSSDTEDESSFYQMLDSEKISAKKAEQLMLERESALEGSSQASDCCCKIIEPHHK